jgi:hypothetical protein
MLGRLILVVVQLGACWFGAPLVLGYLPRGLGGDVTTLLHAGLFGVIAWVVGLVGSQALKDVALPSSKTLAWALAGGLIGGALVIFKVNTFIPLKFAPMFMPLGLAILGYAIKK